jgi:hypothetical protein
VTAGGALFVGDGTSAAAAIFDYPDSEFAREERQTLGAEIRPTVPK